MPQTSSEITRVKRAVRERDGMRCTKCGVTQERHLFTHGRALEVHRLVPGSVYTPEGCVTLCKECHGPEPRRPRGSPDHADGSHEFQVVALGSRVPRLRYRVARLAAHKRTTASAYLLALISAVVERDEAAMSVA